MNALPEVAINFCSQITHQSISALINAAQQGLNRGAKRIRLLLTSGGGDPNAALAAYNFLSGLSVEVVTHNYGVCDSAAVLLFCAGDIRLSCSQSKFLIHESRGSIKDANADKLDEAVQQLRQIENLQARVIADNCNKSVEEILRFMHGASAVLDATQAVEWKLVTAIENTILREGAKAVFIGVSAENPETLKGG